MGQRSAQPIQLPNNEDISGPYKRQRLVQSQPIILGARGVIFKQGAGRRRTAASSASRCRSVICRSVRMKRAVTNQHNDSVFRTFFARDPSAAVAQGVQAISGIRGRNAPFLNAAPVPSLFRHLPVLIVVSEQNSSGASC